MDLRKYDPLRVPGSRVVRAAVFSVASTATVFTMGWGAVALRRAGADEGSAVQVLLVLLLAGFGAWALVCQTAQVLAAAGTRLRRKLRG